MTHYLLSTHWSNTMHMTNMRLVTSPEGVYETLRKYLTKHNAEQASSRFGNEISFEKFLENRRYRVYAVTPDSNEGPKILNHKKLLGIIGEYTQEH